MREVAIGDFRLDAGPTVFTMRWVFEELFAAAGTSFEQHVRISPLDILARHHWPIAPIKILLYPQAKTDCCTWLTHRLLAASENFAVKKSPTANSKRSACSRAAGCKFNDPPKKVYSPRRTNSSNYFRPPTARCMAPRITVGKVLSAGMARAANYPDYI